MPGDRSSSSDRSSRSSMWRRAVPLLLLLGAALLGSMVAPNETAAFAAFCIETSLSALATVLNGALLPVKLVCLLATIFLRCFALSFALLSQHFGTAEHGIGSSAVALQQVATDAALALNTPVAQLPWWWWTAPAEPAEYSVVAITGASSGIGAEVAREYAMRGDVVVLAARRVDRLQAVAEDCLALGARNASVVQYDASDAAAGDRLIAAVIARHGRLDVLVLNAGYGGPWMRMEAFSPPSPPPTTGSADGPASCESPSSLREVEQVMEVNYMGYVRATVAAIPSLKASRGRIVVVSSMYANFAAPFLAGYSASKHALTGFYNTLRHELSPHGVSVTLHFPGGVATEITERFVTASGESKPIQFPSIFLANATECAQSIVHAADTRQPRAHFPAYAHVLAAAHALWPDPLDLTYTRLVEFYITQGLIVQAGDSQNSP